MVAEKRETVTGLARAIARAETLIHGDRPAAVAAILREFPDMERRHVEKVVEVYQTAIPTSPRVSSKGFQAALELFPASRQPPDLSGLDLNEFVAPEFADAVAESTVRPDK
jgi:hypothetical protein